VRFGAGAASASLLGLVSLALFAVVFSWGGLRLHWGAALLVAWVVTLVADLGLARVGLPAVAGLVVVLVAIEVAGRSLPRGASEAGHRKPWPWWDLPGRAVATGVLVVAVTSAAGVAGPGLTGVLAPFPIATSVVAAFVLATRGAGSAAETLRGTLRGLRGFGLFCFLVAVLVEHLGTTRSFLIAAVAAVATTAVRPMGAVASRYARATWPGGPRPRAAGPSFSGGPGRSSAACPAAPAASPAAADD
jgi:hypothetical protein